MRFFETLCNLFLGLFAALVAACVLMSFLLAFNSLFEIFTGYDILRVEIRPRLERIGR